MKSFGILSSLKSSIYPLVPDTVEGRQANSEDWNITPLIMLETLRNASTLSRLQLFSAIQRIVGAILVWNSGNKSSFCY